ncbi:kinase-like protein [Auriscalpium vulgare]|uniref:Kinase-like protein n=1 Tax=Auriscalpium vulgare TaxID=40419 RepID=A0ACB8RY21_9AGAM|nr:kinase-like protein [Auriscalpium vulgare]
MSHSSTSSGASVMTALIASLDDTTIQDFAVTARRDYLRRHNPGNGAAVHADLSCTVATPPASGSSNIVYTLEFSDGAKWVLRIPFEEWSDAQAHRMRLDIVAQQYILSHTSIPIPRIYSYDCTSDNALGHPYMLMAFVHGTRLVDVWNDPTWWTGERTKARLLNSYARHMVELARLEFDAIGCLDKVEPDGPHFIAPFPTTSPGPFKSAHTYISTVLNEELRTHHDPFLAALHIFLNSLLERQYDGAPFILRHPDPDSQNVFVDETGEVSGLIDWDNVQIRPRQLGALAFPAWLTVDWDPIAYFMYADEPHCDTREDLHMYRNMYVDGIAKASDGALSAVTRNSHIICSIMMAICNEYTRQDVVYHLGTYMFGSAWLTIELVEGMKGSAWFNRDPDAIAEVKESDKNRLAPEEYDLRTADGSNESDGEDVEADSSNDSNESNGSGGAEVAI